MTEEHEVRGELRRSLDFPEYTLTLTWSQSGIGQFTATDGSGEASYCVGVTDQGKRWKALVRHRGCWRPILDQPHMSSDDARRLVESFHTREKADPPEVTEMKRRANDNPCPRVFYRFLPRPEWGHGVLTGELEGLVQLVFEDRRERVLRDGPLLERVCYSMKDAVRLLQKITKPQPNKGPRNTAQRPKKRARSMDVLDLPSWMVRRGYF